MTMDPEKEEDDDDDSDYDYDSDLMEMSDYDFALDEFGKPNFVLDWEPLDERVIYEMRFGRRVRGMRDGQSDGFHELSTVPKAIVDDNRAKSVGADGKSDGIDELSAIVADVDVDDKRAKSVGADGFQILSSATNDEIPDEWISGTVRVTLEYETQGSRSSPMMSAILFNRRHKRIRVKFFFFCLTNNFFANLTFLFWFF